MRHPPSSRKSNRGMAKQGGRRRNSMGLRGGTCGICCVLTSAHRTRRAERLWLARRQNEQGCLRQSGEACLRLPERGSPKSSQRRLSGASSPTCPHSLLRGAITTLRKDQQGGVRRRGKTGYLECAALRNLARNVSFGNLGAEQQGGRLRCSKAGYRSVPGALTSSF